MIESPTKQVVRQPGDGYWEKFEQFQRTRGDREAAWLVALRKAGIARFAETGFPTTQDEDWRFTNVAPIARRPFSPLTGSAREPLARELLSGLTFKDLRGPRLVFVDGQFSPGLSRVTPPGEGITIQNLAAAVEHNSPIVERHLGRHSQNAHNAFVALNTAFFTDGALIHVAQRKKASEPVQLIHITTSNDNGATSSLRHLIVAESGSELTVIENHVSPPESTHLTNCVTELVIGDGAQVEHCKFQDESLNAYHMAAIHASLGGGCNFASHSLALGARLSRNNIRTVLDGQGVECILNGLYLTKDDQLADHHMIVEHAQPHCNSHEYFNGILDGRSRGVFHGRILVRQIAQKTDAKQTNKNLLLSDDAGVNTKPQLEIYADDVKCTHGATIGQLNDESIFYLRARGIGKETARRMLMHSFAAEIIDRIRCEPAREELNQLIWDRLEQNSQISVAR